MDSDVSDYDEDVIHPFSPLSEYIDSYVPYENPDLNKSEQCPDKDTSYQSEKSFNMYDSLLYCLYAILDASKLYFSYIYCIFVPSLTPFEYSDLRNILKSAKFNNVLVSEDLTVLLNYESDDEFSGELRLSYATVFQQCFQLFGFVMIYMILKSAKAVNVFATEDFLQILPDRLYFLYVLVEILIWFASKALCIIIFIIILFICTNLSELFLCKILCYSIKKNLKKTEGIITLLKKCLRLIQEAELIARGFTSASIPGIVEHLELSAGLPLSSPQRQYPELRKYIYIWTKEIFALYRNATQTLIANSTFFPVLDFTTQSLATLDLKEFGDLLKYDINSEADLEELLKFSDNLSVSSLKTMYLLAELQISEFYKYLYFKVSFLISDEDLFHCVKRIKHFQCLDYSLKCIQSKQLYVYEQACKLYKYYRSLEMLSDDDKISPKKSNSSSLEINAHNMSLHLKSALKRLTELEELFEMSRSPNDSKNEKVLKKAESMSKEIKSEIDAYNEYYQKCNCELQNILYGKKESPDNSLLQEEINRLETVETTFIVQCDTEPYIEDEIYEAVVTKASFENDNLEDFPFEERKNIEVAGKLMHELKNVLVIKADEHRLREQKALAKKLNQNELLHNVSLSLDTLTRNVIDIDQVELAATDHLENLNDHSSYDGEVSESSLDSYEEENISGADVEINGMPNSNNSFAASIAALALQRQKMLGISDDACFSDGGSDEVFD